jgi:Flp pilus assembly protein TadB
MTFLNSKSGAEQRFISWVITLGLMFALGGLGTILSETLAVPLITGLLVILLQLFLLYKEFWKNQLPLLFYKDSVKSKGEFKSYPGVGERIMYAILGLVLLVGIALIAGVICMVTGVGIAAAPIVGAAIGIGWMLYFDVYKMILRDDMPFPFYHRKKNGKNGRK